MALSRAGYCWALCRRGPGPGLAGAAALRRARGLLEPRSARGAPRPLVRCLSAKASSQAFLAAFVSKVKRINGRYERFLERTFPRFYVLYTTFTKGIQALFWEVKEIRKIKLKMSRQRLNSHQLPYREMERLRQFRRDLIKAIPIGIIAIPPFANFLVIVLMYFFPRQLLIRYFWTPQQQVEFLDAYHAIRREAYSDVVKSLALAARSLPEPRLREQLQELCTKKALSHVLFLTPHLPAFFLRYRLRSHVLEIRHLDRAMLRLGLSELSEEELKAACYLRGLDSTHLSASECRAWLERWLGLSCRLQASEASLLANSMVLLSLNYVRAKE
ncbi:LETM1 domain-containing protein 1 isoform X3 [Apteryx mantelli]|uniref:LETM1 domain-containing protein 1 isoform X3 n=1 Tax=Apteryx mantelli TaxID=2696672 RepID=A0ABM4FZC5_9AVES